jgi:hypothetical protein
MIAIAIPAAIRPYSIAVAPDSSATKFFRILFNYTSQGVALAWPNNCKIDFAS